jgi:hypothetical protein
VPLREEIPMQAFGSKGESARQEWLRLNRCALAELERKCYFADRKFLMSKQTAAARAECDQTCKAAHDEYGRRLKVAREAYLKALAAPTAPPSSSAASSGYSAP